MNTQISAIAMDVFFISFNPCIICFKLINLFAY